MCSGRLSLVGSPELGAAHVVLPPLDPAVLPARIRSRFIDRINGLRAHVLEAGEPGRPLAVH